MNDYRLQNPTSGVIGPIKLQTVRDLAQSGAVRKDVLVAKDDGPFLPIAAFAELSDILSVLPEAPIASYAGDLVRVPFLKLLLRLLDQRATGQLVVRDGTRRKDIYLEEGAPAFVTSTSPKERLGELLVSQGKITPEALRNALLQAQQTAKPLPEVLATLNLLSDASLRASLREQQVLRMVDVSTWDRGGYSFYDGRVYKGPRLYLELTVAEVAVRAARALSERSAMARMEKNLHERPCRVNSALFDACAVELNDEERLALDRVDGLKTVVQLLIEPGPRRTLLSVLFLLRETGAVTFVR